MTGDQNVPCAPNPTPRKGSSRAAVQLRVIFDKVGNTLNVWFDDPQKEHVCEETAEEIILVKDKTGKVIGFEVLNYLSARESRKITTLPVEAAILD